jgi:hypothetical protein
MAGYPWEEHLSGLIVLYRVLMGSVLKYGSVCFTNMTKTHILGLKRVQYRALRGVLGMACGISTLWNLFLVEKHILKKLTNVLFMKPRELLTVLFSIASW